MRATLARRLALAASAFALVAVQCSWAQDEHTHAGQGHDDVAQLQSCILDHAQDVPQFCIGRIATVCLDAWGADGQDSRCYRRETIAWQNLIERYDVQIRQNLVGSDAVKSFVDSSVAWIDSRDKFCRFSLEFSGNTASDPLVDRCYEESDGRRAIYLNHLIKSAHIATS